MTFDAEKSCELQFPWFPMRLHRFVTLCPLKSIASGSIETTLDAPTAIGNDSR